MSTSERTVVVATGEEVKEAAKRFPNMPVREGIVAYRTLTEAFESVFGKVEGHE